MTRMLPTLAPLLYTMTYEYSSAQIAPEPCWKRPLGFTKVSYGILNFTGFIDSLVVFEENCRLIRDIKEGKVSASVIEPVKVHSRKRSARGA